MKTQTSENIIDFIKKNSGKARPDELIRYFGLTPAAIHRHLKKLVEKGRLAKHGKPPLVVYSVVDEEKLPASYQFSPSVLECIEKNYLYINPKGQMLYGANGFVSWALKNNPHQPPQSLAEEYKKTILEAHKFFNKDDLIEGVLKLKRIFPKVFLEEVYYQDFYSLPKFGKTKLGQLVLYSKQAQDSKIIHQVADYCKNPLLKLIKKLKVEAVAWVPHSIPRKIPFLKELRKTCELHIPEIKVIKAYAGEIPVAQKSLSKLEERIENARDTLFLKDNIIPYKNILLIDDALGSGSTINEVAKKIKALNPKIKIFAFILVGSFKGFEVIREV